MVITLQESKQKQSRPGFVVYYINYNVLTILMLRRVFEHKLYYFSMLVMCRHGAEYIVMSTSTLLVDEYEYEYIAKT